MRTQVGRVAADVGGATAMIATRGDHARHLLAIAHESTWFMDVLAAVRDLGLASWCVGAGVVRNLVWDALHDHATRSALADVDVAHFDAHDLSPSRDAARQRALCESMPDVPWEVANQAAVHVWFERSFGHAVAPLTSLHEAVASWPEYATSVGMTLNADDSIDVIAPHGLDDLFAMVVRRNPTRVSVATYRERVATKRYAERWPRVRVVPA